MTRRALPRQGAGSRRGREPIASQGHGHVVSAAARQGYLSLLKRWYYRPESKRTGEIFFPDEDGLWPVKALLRGVGRIAAKSLSGPTAA